MQVTITDSKGFDPEQVERVSEPVRTAVLTGQINRATVAVIGIPLSDEASGATGCAVPVWNAEDATEQEQLEAAVAVLSTLQDLVYRHPLWQLAAQLANQGAMSQSLEEALSL